MTPPASDASVRPSLVRRTLLAGLGGALAAPAAPARPGEDRPLTVGLQLYTVGQALDADLPGTLRKVGAIGYRDVELFSWNGRTPGQMKSELSAAGLTCVSVHAGAMAFDQDASGIGPARDIGARYIVCPMPPVPPRLRATAFGPNGPISKDALVAAFRAMTHDDWKHAADFLNRTGEAARRAGLVLAYHNHNLEFRRFPRTEGLQPAQTAAPAAGRTDGWDVLWRRTDPDLVRFEVDLGWIAASGQDPKTFLKAHAARVALIHLKDLKPTPPNSDLIIRSTEAGAGVQDWRGILRAAREAGLRLGFVEQEPPDMTDPLKSVKASFDYLTGLQAQIWK